MKRKVSVLLSFLFAILPCFAGSSLRLLLTNGDEIVCNLEKEPQMTFGEKTLGLTSLDGSVGEWDFAEVESWSFVETVGIDGVGEDKSVISIEGEKIEVAGEAAKSVAVYDISGKTIATVKENGNGVTRISLGGLEKGAYILKAGKNSIKFLVK